MVPDLELKEKPNGKLEVSATKENGSIPQDSEERITQCINNSEDRNFDIEPPIKDQDKVQDGIDDMEVNIIACTNCGDVGQVETRCEDATESISSFGDTTCEAENTSAFSDVEVESQFCIGDQPMFIFDGCGGASTMRRKKLTDHWRRFIRPIMWRLKWLELQLKEFRNRARKYDKELAENEQRKQFDYETFLVDGFDAKSQPFSSCVQRRKVMNRKKRMRFEETVDVSSYMTQHNLFSYYENKKPPFAGATVVDDYGNPENLKHGNDNFGFQEDWATVESTDDDNIYGLALRKIEALQLQVRKLRARVDKVVSENPGILNGLSLPTSNDDGSTSSDQNPASPEIEDDVPAEPLYTKHISEGDLVDFLPGKTVLSHEEVTPLSGTIENSGQPQVGGSCEHNEEAILMHNQAANEEMQSIENLGSQLKANPQVPMDKMPAQASEDNLQSEGLVARVRFGGKSLPKSRPNASNGKRKRGKRKPGVGGRRRSSG